MASKSPPSVPRNAQGHGTPFAADELIGRLYAAEHQGVAAVVADLPPAERANLALFCYHRAHLREIGFAIAATCDRWSLVNAAGRAGDALFLSSRSQPVLERPVAIGRRKVTLASLVPGSTRFVGGVEDDEAEDEPLDA